MHGLLEMCKQQRCPWACRACTLLRCCPWHSLRSFPSNGPAFRKEGSEISAIHVLWSVGVSLSEGTVLSASLWDLQTIWALSHSLRKHLISKSNNVLGLKSVSKFLDSKATKSRKGSSGLNPEDSLQKLLILHLLHPLLLAEFSKARLLE